MHTFELDDRKGKTHKYGCDPHPGTQGAGLALRIQALGVEPVVAIFRAVIASPAVQQLGDALRSDAPADAGELLARAGGDLLAALRTADLSDLGQAAAKVFAHPEGPKLVRDVLARTYRDGKPLSEDHHFDEAYQANYGELLRVMVEVIRFNGFFPLADLLSSSESAPPKAADKPAPARRSSTRAAT